jgi:hypothetical protein
MAAALEYALSYHAGDGVTVLHATDGTDSATFGAELNNPVNPEATGDFANEVPEVARQVAKDFGVDVTRAVEYGRPL